MSKNETAPVEKQKRKYTKTLRYTVIAGSETTQTSGLIEALKIANEKLRDNVCDEVTISRIKRDV